MRDFYIYKKLSKEKILYKKRILYKKGIKFLLTEFNKANNQNLNHKQIEMFMGHWVSTFTKIFLRTYNSSEKIDEKDNVIFNVPKNSYSDFVSIISKNEWKQNIISQVRKIKNNKNFKITKVKIYENKNKIVFFKKILIKLHNIFCLLFKVYFSKKKNFYF